MTTLVKVVGLLVVVEAVLVIVVVVEEKVEVGILVVLVVMLVLEDLVDATTENVRGKSTERLVGSIGAQPSSMRISERGDSREARAIDPILRRT
jgi:hypothetical protein